MSKDRVIALMGVTGAGKSAFIKLVTGDESIKVGNSLESETSVITTHRFRHKDRTIMLVDTPGFDDTQKKDSDVLKVLADWFESTYKSGIRLTGIIYLHRITDDRMRGSSMRSIRMFRKLCGESFYSNLMLGTTCWSLTSEEDGSKKEKELMTDQNFWRGFISKGAQFVRIPDDGFDAKELVYDLARLEPAALQIQSEMVDQHINFEDLSATEAIDGGLSKLRAEQAEMKRKLEQENLRKAAEQQKQQEALRLQFADENRAKLLRFRQTAEHQKMEESLAKFNEGLKANTYMAKVYPLSVAFSTTCDDCCKWVGNSTYYDEPAAEFVQVCSECPDKSYTLCADCHADDKSICYDRSHKASRKAAVAGDAPVNCRLLKYPIAHNTYFACYRCKEQIEGIFAHCCSCLNDTFNMCLECLTKLGTCKKSSSLSGHRLYPVMRRLKQSSVPENSTGVNEASQQGDPKVDGNKSSSWDNTAVTCKVLFNQAERAMNEKNWVEASRFYKQILELREKDYPIEDELIRESNYFLGLACESLKNLEEAAIRLEKALKGETIAYGPDDTRKLYTSHRLGIVCQNLSQYDRAIPLLEDAVRRKDTLGLKDPTVRLSYYNLGDVHMKRKDYSAAAKMFEMTLKGEEEGLGVDHVDTLTTVARLGNAYRCSERYDEAIAFNKRAMTSYSRTLGEDHKKTLDAAHDLGIANRDAGKHAAAADNFRMAMDGYKRTLKPDDSEIFDACDKTAGSLVSDGQLSSAMDLYVQTLASRKKHLGIYHEETKENEKKIVELQQKINELSKPSVPPASPAQSRPAEEVTRQPPPAYTNANRSTSGNNTGLFTPPMSPITQYNPQHLKLILSGQLSVLSKDSDGRGPLFCAVQENNDNAVSKLLEMGAEVNLVSNRGKSVTHLAAQYGSAPMVLELLKKGAPLSLPDRNGDTPLHLAAADGRSDVVGALLDFNATQKEDSLTEAQNNSGYTALHLATIGGSLKVAERLMDSNVSFCDTSAEHGMNATLFAAEMGEVDLLKLFIERGADLETLSGNGMTALHYAAIKGHSAATEVLLDAGAKTETKSLPNQWTALLYSLTHNHDAVSQLLLGKGADIFATESSGLPLVYYLISTDLIGGVRCLLDYGLSVDLADHQGQTLLHSSLRQNSPKVLQLLLARGANARLAAQGGISSLHYAVHFDTDVTAASMLVSRGADVNFQDSNGLTALNVAAIQGKESWVGILLSLGADPNLEDLLGQNALQIAAANNKTTIVTLLMCRDLKISQ